MKKLVWIIGLLVLVSGCGNKMSKYEELMQEYANTYFLKHMSGIEGQTFAEITIAMLDKANEVGVGNYDLNKLKKCKRDSKVTLEINDDKSIKGYQYAMKCQ